MADATSSLFESTVFNIEKLDGTNFPFRKEQIYNVLVQKKRVKPIKLKGVKPENMDQDEWAKMDELARSTIVLAVSKRIYYNVNKTVTAYDLWSKLCTLYEQKSAALQIYWLKKLVDLKMKDGVSMSSHLMSSILSSISSVVRLYS